MTWHDVPVGWVEPEGRGFDLLSRVREICRLRIDQDRSTSGAEIVERNRGAGGVEFNHLVVHYTRGPWMKEHVVGVYEGSADAETVTRFRDAICAHIRTEREPELVHWGVSPSPDTERAGREHRIWLRSFAEYQHVWEHQSYLEAQTKRLLGDSEYPLRRHVDKRWSELGEGAARPTTAAAHILELLKTDGPRFILVLGDFGTGKTFLLRALAERLAHDGSGLVPVLVSMRELTKGRTLDELLAQHMSRDDSYHRASFRYLLREGKIALLFDGFDELAQRTDYDRVVDHFNTLREAADGAAKVIVTSRHQYFATDRDIRTALGGQAQALPGSRIMRLLPLDAGQRRTLVVEDFDDEAAAEHFLALLGGVRDLLSLAENPRMLSFMIRWYRAGVLTDAKLVADADEPITAGRLYERLLTTWLEHEFRRQDEPGGPGPLSVAERLDALGELALQLWRNSEAAVPAADLGSAAAKVADLTRLQMRPGEAAQAVGSSTVLVRVGEDAFSFIHQSVLEWLVARWIAQGGEKRLSSGPLSALMVDFLCDLAGDNTVVSWAVAMARTTSGATPTTKANAALILQRRGITVQTVTFAGADLGGQDLSTQDLTGADLSAANLSGAVLPRALRGAILRRAQLVEARLNGADLTGADLRDSDLSRAHLIGADLRGAQLAGAVLDRTVLVGATLDLDALANSASQFGTALPDSPVDAQLGSVAYISALAAVTDDGILATGHADGAVQLWDQRTALPLRTLESHHGSVHALAVDPGGHWLASAGEDGTVRLWDPSTGKPMHTLEGHIGRVRALATDPRGHWLASAGNDSTVRLWDPSTGTPLHTLKDHYQLWALTVDPGGHWLASAGEDGTVRLWDPSTGKLMRTLEGHIGRVRALATDPRGHWLASAGNDSTVRLWDPSAGTPLRNLEHQRERVRALAVDPHGDWLACASGDGTVRLWDPSTGKPLHTLEGHPKGIDILATDPKGQWLASSASSRNTAVQLWDPNTGKPLRSLEGPHRWVRALALPPGGHWLASAGNDGAIRLLDPSTGTVLLTIEGHRCWVRALAVDPHGDWLASADEEGTVRLWNPSTGAPLHTLESHRRGIWALAADPGGHWLASADSDGEIRLWDPSTGTPLHNLEGPRSWVRALAVDPHGDWLASADEEGTVWLWDPTTGAPLRTLESHRHGLWALAVDPYGNWLACAGDDGTIRLWKPDTGRPLRTLAGHTGGLRALAIGPNGNWLASAGDDGTIRLWNPDTGTPLRTLAGHTGGLRALAIGPNGDWLASAGNDGSIRLWNPSTGTLLATVVASEEGWAVLFPDGSYKLYGKPSELWWAIGLCRFDPVDLPDIAPHQPLLRRLHDDAPLMS